MLAKPFRSYRLQEAMGHLFIHAVLIAISIACLVPMILIVSISLSDEAAITTQGFSLWPVGFTTHAY